MAGGPHHRRAVLARVAGEGPHHIDQIFGLADGAAPHVLVAVRKLRRRSRMKRQPLRQIELDGVAPGLEDAARDAEDQGMLNDLRGQRRAREQPTEALGARSVEAAVAEGRIAKVSGEIRVDGLDQLRRERIRNHAPALLEKQPGPALDLRARARFQVTHCCALLVMRLADADVATVSEVPDVIGCKQLRSVRPDLDRERSDRPALEPCRSPERPAVPAEGEDLLKPCKLGHARVGADCGLERMPGERRHQLVAGPPPRCRILPAR